MIDDSKLPWSPDAEQAVLGGLLIDPAAYDKVGDKLSRKHFFNASHGLLFELIASMAIANKPVDTVTVYAALQRSRDPAAADMTQDYLHALATTVPSSSNAQRYAEIILEHWMERAIMEEADAAMSLASGPGSAHEKLHSIVTAFDRIQRGTVKSVPVPIGDVMTQVLERVNDLNERGEEALSGMSTGYPGLDDLFNGGLQEGRVYLLGGRPGLGKTALALGVAADAGERGLPTAVLNQEMGKRELGERIASRFGTIDYKRIQTGKLSNAEWGRLAAAVEKLAQCTLFLDDQEGLTIADIRAKARAVRGLKLLVLDYVQLCAGVDDNRDQTRNSELEVISRGLKSLAREMGIAVLVLSALNRRVDDRPRGRPIMSDFKDCGALEADADVLMALWKIRDQADGTRLVACELLKNRQGRTGAVVLEFSGHTQSFDESEYRLEELLKEDRAKKEKL